MDRRWPAVVRKTLHACGAGFSAGTYRRDGAAALTNESAVSCWAGEKDDRMANIAWCWVPDWARFWIGVLIVFFVHCVRAGAGAPIHPATHPHIHTSTHPPIHTSCDGQEAPEEARLVGPAVICGAPVGLREEILAC